MADPIVVRLTESVHGYPVGAELGYKDVATATSILGAGTFEVVREQDGDPITPPTPEELSEAEQAALALRQARRLIRGSEFDPVVPGPGEVIVGGASGPVAVAGGGSGPMGAFNIAPATTAKWRRALARVRAGQGSAKLLCAGDSTTWGLTAENVTVNSYPVRLEKALNSHYLPASQGLVIPTGATGEPDDPRWTRGSWVRNPYGLGLAACYTAPSAIGSSPLTFTPGVNCDTIDVYYLETSVNPILSVNVDGGAAVTKNLNGVSGNWGKMTVTAPAGSSHVVTLARTSGGDARIMGIDAYLAADRKIRVSNAGVSGSSSTDWVGASSLSGITTYAPDLTVLMLGINDARQQRSTEGYIANLRTIIQTASASGDVLLMSMVPSGEAVTIDYETEYRAHLLPLALELGCGYIDIFDRFGTYATSSALGLMSDVVHPNALGAADIAGAVASALMQV